MSMPTHCALQDANGAVQELEVECMPIEKTEKPKGFIQWVSQPIFCEVRIYDRLYLSALFTLSHLHCPFVPYVPYVLFFCSFVPRGYAVRTPIKITPLARECCE